MFTLINFNIFSSVCPSFSSPSSAKLCTMIFRLLFSSSFFVFSLSSFSFSCLSFPCISLISLSCFLITSSNCIIFSIRGAISLFTVSLICSPKSLVNFPAKDFINSSISFFFIFFCLVWVGTCLKGIFYFLRWDFLFSI
uniref:Uncharacterized protein n=1 Tax=Cacopsylla melanoneura TaxID=428564 RepID=A0A8D8SYS0_9HEMI